MSYSPEDRAKFVLWLTECHDSYASFGVRVRRELGRDAKVPKKDLVFGWKKKLCETGRLERKKVALIKTARGEDKVDEARAIEENPHLSVRRLSNALKISYGSAQKMLKKDLKMCPYKLQLVQELLPADQKN